MALICSFDSYLVFAVIAEEVSGTRASVSADLIDTSGVVVTGFTQAFVDFRGASLILVT